MSSDDCRAGVEATYAIFANPTQGKAFERALVDFGETYRPAFDNVGHESHEKLMRQSSNLLASIQTACGRYTSTDLYLPVLDVYLRSVPLNVKQINEIMRDVCGDHFDQAPPAMREMILESLLRNVIDFKVFERQALIEQRSKTQIFSDQAAFFLGESEKVTGDIFYRAAEHDDDMFFKKFQEPLLEHVFSLRGMPTVYNPIALAIFASEQHFRAGIQYKDETSPTQQWFITHQAEMVEAVLAHSWHGKFHVKFAQKLENLDPLFTPLVNAVKLRARDVRDWHLVELLHDHGIAPDPEAITILKGAYSAVPGSPMDCDLRALMVYSLIYGDVLGDDWQAPKDVNPLELIENCWQLATSRNVIDQTALDSIVPRALSLLGRQHEIDWIMDCELFKPYLRKHRHFQGLRLEEGLGL